MITLALEDDIGREAVLMPLKRERPCDRLCCYRAGEARDEVENQVVPRHRGARADQFLTMPRNHKYALRMDRDRRIGLGEAARVAVMNRRILAVEKAGLGEQE